MDSGSVELITVWFTGPILIANFLSCCAAGGVLALITAYAQRFGKSDRLVFRLLVGAFTVLLLADVANECHWAYRYAVEGQLDPSILVLLPPQFIVYSAITGVTILFVQGFFTWRIWIISGRSNYVFPAVLALLELSAFGIALYMIHEATQRKLFREFGEVRGAPWAWLALGLLVDMLITGGTTYYLLVKPRKNGATIKDAVVHSPMTRVVLLTARTNALSLFMQVVTLIVKIYIASVLVTRAAILSASFAVLAKPDRSSSTRPQSTLAARRATPLPSSPTLRAPRASPRRFGARSTASRSQHQSVQVHIEEETHVDDSSVGGLAAGAAQPGARPYAVMFESARTDESGWTGGEKGDVELGRLDSVQLSEKF